MKRKPIKKEPAKSRLPMAAVDLLKTRGGPQTTPKGNRGYDRKQMKKNLNKEVDKMLNETKSGITALL